MQFKLQHATISLRKKWANQPCIWHFLSVQQGSPFLVCVGGGGAIMEGVCACVRACVRVCVCVCPLYAFAYHSQDHMLTTLVLGINICP